MIFERPPLETLAMARDRWTPIYLEHGRLEVISSRAFVLSRALCFDNFAKSREPGKSSWNREGREMRENRMACTIPSSSAYFANFAV